MYVYMCVINWISSNMTSIFKKATAVFKNIRFSLVSQRNAHTYKNVKCVFFLSLLYQGNWRHSFPLLRHDTYTMSRCLSLNTSSKVLALHSPGVTHCCSFEEFSKWKAGQSTCVSVKPNQSTHFLISDLLILRVYSCYEEDAELSRSLQLCIASVRAHSQWRVY